MHAYLGDRSFANLVKAYIAANPSDQRSARWFGRHMPAFIAKSATFAKHPEVAELATLEMALADAFDGPDAEPLRLAELAEVPPEAWPELVLAPHPTAIRLTFATNAARDLGRAQGRGSRQSSRSDCRNDKRSSSGATASWRASSRSRPRKP